MPDLVPAIYHGPGDGQLPDGRTVQPGDEVYVTPAQLDSGWFSPVPASKPAAVKVEKPTEGEG